MKNFKILGYFWIVNFAYMILFDYSLHHQRRATTLRKILYDLKTVYFISARAIPSSIILNFKGCKFQLNQKSSLHIRKNGLFEHVGTVRIILNGISCTSLKYFFTNISKRLRCISFDFFFIKKLNFRFFFISI